MKDHKALIPLNNFEYSIRYSNIFLCLLITAPTMLHKMKLLNLVTSDLDTCGLCSYLSIVMSTRNQRLP